MNLILNIIHYERNHYHVIILLSCSLILSGCSDSIPIEVTDPSGSVTSICVQVNKKISDEIITRAFDDSHIYDLHILIYNSSGQLTNHHYTKGNVVTMEALSGSGCTLFAIANTNNSTLFTETNVQTITKLKSFITNENSDADLFKSDGGLLMCGSLSGVTIKKGMPTQMITGLSVKRLTAKITVNVTTASDISITGYSIKNLPSKTYLVPRPNLNESSMSDLVVGDDAPNTPFNTVKVDAASIKDLSFYMYENRRGDRVSIGGTKGKVANQNEKAKYAPPNATYIEIYAKGKNFTATYAVFFGADNSRNYNIKRNSSYVYNVNILNALETDTRVSKVALPSNCYIVGTNKQVVFPISRANEDGVIRIDDLTSGWTADLLWTDNSGGIKANGTSPIKAITAQLDKGTVKVETGSVSGNAVVVVRKAGVIVWSWHIWVTTYNPDITYVSYNNGTSSTVFMDRNLGANSSSRTSTNSRGLFYQWGRKDPFPGTNKYVASTSDPIYNASGTLLTENGQSGTGVKILSVNNVNNLEESVRNPLVVYKGISTVYDWYTSTAIQNDDLWGGVSGIKSVYDPCPEGWRVPFSFKDGYSPWYKMNATQPSNYYGRWTVGWYWNNTAYKLGWYPASGYRSGESGSIFSVKTEGYYWTAMSSGNYAYMFYFNINNVFMSHNFRSTSCSIRCVKEIN